MTWKDYRCSDACARHVAQCPRCRKEGKELYGPKLYTGGALILFAAVLAYWFLVLLATSPR